MTYAYQLTRFAKMPALVVGRTVWPFWPIVIRSRRLPTPEFPLDTIAFKAYHRDAEYYAWLPIAYLLRFLDWCDQHRWCVEEWCIRRGIMTGPDGGYYHEFRFAPIRHWHIKYPSWQ